MASLGKLWFELGIRDDVTKDLNKVLNMFNELDGDIGKILESANKLGKIKQTEFVNSQAVKNATTYNGMLRKINAEILKLQGKKDKADRLGIDPKSIRDSITALQEFSNKLQTIKSVDSGKVELSAYKQAYTILAQQINDVVKAIDQETKAQERLNNERKKSQIDAHNMRVRLYGQNIRSVVNEYNKLNSLTATQSRIMQQLNSQMSMYFSIYTVERFLRSIIQIGGEFEKQRIAIKSILGSATQANQLYNQLKGLAVESPFTFLNLTTYAKQLTSFSIPYNELYDTTKRLADVSAGLGVDMQRIILAYGQVRSASFLKGTELRQFTEAGIPLLDRLAKKFSELEGRVVTAGDVMKKISSRQVTFQMVKDVLWEMTDAGGQFYNMQAVLTETLPGKWEKLKDTWQIMLSDLAEGTSLTGKLFQVSLDGITNLVRGLSTLQPLFYGLIGGALINGVNKNLYKAFSAKPVKEMVLEAQRLNMLEIQRRHLLGEIGVKQYNNLIKQNQQTSGVYRQLIMENRLSMLKIRQLVQSGEINRELVKESVTLGFIEKKYEKLILGQGKLNGLILAGRNAWSKFIVPNAWFLGISAAIAIVSSLYQKYKEVGEAAKKATDAAQEGFGSLANTVRKLNAEENKDGNLSSSIIAAKNALKEIDPYYDKMLKAIENTVELSKQYKILKERLDDLKDAYEYFGDDEGLFKDAYKINVTRSGTPDGFDSHNIDYFFGEFSKQIEKAQKEIRKISQTGTDALYTIFESFDEWAMNVYGEDGKLLSVFDILYNMFNGGNEYRKQNFDKLVQELEKQGKDAVADVVKSVYRDLSTGTVPERMAEAFNNFLVVPFKQSATDMPYAQWSTLFWQNFSKSLKNYGNARVQSLFEAAFKKAIGDEFQMDGIVNDPNSGNSSPDAGNKSKKDTFLEKMKHRYELLKKYHSELEKYKKVMSETQAIEKLRQNGNFPEVSEWFKDASNMNQSITEIIDEMNDSTEPRKEFIRSLKEGIEQDNRDKLLKGIETTNNALKEQLDIVQEQYETYKKWVKLTGDEDMASRMAFGGGVENKSYSEYLKSGLNKYLSETGSGYTAEYIFGMSKEQFKEEIGENSEVISQYYNEWIENDKKVRKETADTLYDIISNSRTYEDKLKDINNLYDERIKKIRENKQLTEGEKSNSINAANKERNEKLSEEMFKHFQETSDWVRIFDDLNRVSNMTIDDMITKIDEFSKSSGLSVATIKRLRDALDKLRKEQINRNPIQAITSGFSQAAAIRSFLGGDSGYAVRNGGTAYIGAAQAAKMGLSEGTYNLDDLLNRLAEASDNSVKGLEGMAKGFKEVQSALQPVIDLFDSLGNTTLSDFFKTGSNALGAAASTAGAFTSLSNMAQGAGLGGLSSALGAAGPYGAAAAAALSVASSLIDMHDKSIQKEIDASKQRQKEMQQMTERIKNVLDYTLGGIYKYKAEGSEMSALREQLSKYGSYKDQATIKAIRKAFKTGTAFDAEYASLLAQRDELIRQQNLERQKKKKDKDAIKDYDNEIAEVTQKIKTFAQDFAKEIYDIDLKSWAEDFGDALYDAWKNGEDGMEAYRKTASKILGELTNKVLTMRYIEPALEKVGDLIFGDGRNAFGFFSDGVITEDEVAQLGSAFADIASNVELYNKLMEQVNNSVKGLGFDLKESESSSSSGLSKGIQGMTEETSNLLASYLNAVRADVSYIKLILERAYGSTDNIIAQSQLEQLRIIAANTTVSATSVTEIKALLDRVVRGDAKFNIK